MTLKDWKKVTGDLYEHRYYKKKLQQFLIIYENPANNNFDILLDDDKDERLINVFKTKFQALNFAKSYMRKH